MRLLSIPLNTSILYYDLGSHLVHRLRNDPPAVPLNRLALNPSPARDLPITRLVLLGMATGSSLKQILFAGCLNHECMVGPKAGCAGFAETIYDAINLLLFTNNALSPSFATSQDEATPTLVVGSALYVLGMIVECVSECQRRCFEKCKKNEGKPVNKGLWKVVRHANYLGYMVWRAGFAVAAGGFKWGAAVTAFNILYFAARTCKPLEDCLSEKVRGIRPSASRCRLGKIMDMVRSMKGFGMRSDVMFVVGDRWDESELRTRSRLLIVR